MKLNIRKQLNNLKESPGIYIFKNALGKVLYVGKAVNLKNRVKSYFFGHDNRPQVPKLISEVAKIEIKITDSEIEALLLEADLIKQLRPHYNIDLKDDKSFAYIYINFADDLPTVKIIRKKELDEGRTKIRKKDKLFGPFLKMYQVRLALQELRKIFPWCDKISSKFSAKGGSASGGKVHPFRPRPEPRSESSKLPRRGCQHFQIGLCPGICAGKINKIDYRRIVRQLITVLSGGKKRIIGSLRREMKNYARKRKFEKAAELRDKIKGLEHIGEVSLVKEKNENQMSVLEERIEGYDVANISGKLAVGVMVVYAKVQSSKFKVQNYGFKKDDYRMFKIGTVKAANDVAMMGELLQRRLKHKDWKKPSLIIIDGGAGQVNVVKLQVTRYALRVPLVGIAKGSDRKGEKLFFGESQFEFRFLPEWSRRNIRLIKKIRDEAHRFSQRYFHILQKKEQKESGLKMIKGIGDKTFKKLMMKFGTLQKIKLANFEQLSTVVGKSKAEKLKDR